MSHARYAVSWKELTRTQRQKYFSFIAFTETPLQEIHCLLYIKKRDVNLEPYGLVFLKDRLTDRGVSPVFYVNNVCGDKDAVVRELAALIKKNSAVAAQILPLIEVFGKKLKPVDGASQSGKINFTWEREWRCPFSESPLPFNEADVFVGLCPRDEIHEFERLFPPVRFIDPREKLIQYRSKLDHARNRLGQYLGPLL